MQAEYNFLIENKIWELIYVPQNQQFITSQWCFKLKKNCDGQILIYKTGWVAHDSLPEESINFVETFATVIKLISYKCLFRVGEKRGYQI